MGIDADRVAGKFTAALMQFSSQYRGKAKLTPACRVKLANVGRIVFESDLEPFAMNRVYAFSFSFYTFPQPLAEGLS
jgi:hypothetical protein